MLACGLLGLKVKVETCAGDGEEGCCFQGEGLWYTARQAGAIGGGERRDERVSERTKSTALKVVAYPYSSLILCFTLLRRVLCG